MRVLVTGGGGFLGGAICRRLVEHGHDVRSISRQQYAVLEQLGVEQHAGDLADADAVERACAGIDWVFHVAAKAGVWGPYRDYFQANVVGTRNVIQACRRAGVTKLIYTSTPSVVHTGGDVAGVDESTPIARHFETAYPATKAIAEQEVLAANDATLSTVALRPHLIWGPGDNHLVPRLLDRARRGRLRFIGSGCNLIDATYIDNAAHAHLLAADRLTPGSAPAGKAYFIAQGTPVPLKTFVNQILAAGGLPPVNKHLPLWLGRLLGASLEGVYRILGRVEEPPLTRFVVKQLATAHWYDLTAARRDLGYEPIISIEEGLEELRKWLLTVKCQAPA